MEKEKELDEAFADVLRAIGEALDLVADKEVRRKAMNKVALQLIEDFDTVHEVMKKTAIRMISKL